MPQICHAHCPKDGASLLGFVIGAGAVLVAGGMAIMAVIEQLVIIAGIAVVVLAPAGIWLLVHMVRRDQQHLTTREAVDRAVLALAEPPRKSLPAARKAITGAYVITDATEAREPARIAIKRDGTVTG